MKFLLLFSLFFSSFSFAQDNCLTAKKTPCLIEFERLHPTQLTLGKVSLSGKIKKLEKHYKKGELQKRLKKKAIPAILGPDLLFYIQDGHHEMAALDLSKKIPKEEKIVVISDLVDKSSLTNEEFRTYMLENEKVFLLDKDFNMAKFEDIPRHFDQMEDNPYRSFAWLVKEEGGFCKVSVNYLEFIWGKFFKEIFDSQNLILSSDTELLKSYISLGLEIAHSEKAAHLPGFTSSPCP